MDKNLEKMKSYMSRTRANKYRASDYGLEVLRSLYKNYRNIESYIPEEGKDNPNIHWVEHKDGTYSRILLVDEDGWKIHDISKRR